MFLSFCKAFIYQYIEKATQSPSPFRFKDSQAQESVKKLAVNFVKGLRHARLTQFLLPPPALDFAVMLSRYTNSGIKPGITNLRSAFE